MSWCEATDRHPCAGPAWLLLPEGSRAERAGNAIVAPGKFIDGAGLQSSRRGKQFQLHGAKLRVTDGPFTESKELLGGYSVMDADSDEEALEIATRFMELHRIHWPRIVHAHESVVPR